MKEYLSPQTQGKRSSGLSKWSIELLELSSSESVRFKLEQSFGRLIACNARCYSITTVIRTFRHKGLKQLFETGKSGAVAPDLARRAKLVLDYLDAAITVYDTGIAGLRLHELKGERKATWSVTVSGNWRITFAFRDGDAYEVNLEDYR